MEVEFLSIETIGPSSPPLPHLEPFQLLCLDKSSPLVYTPLLFFYSMTNYGDDQAERAITRLKISLSQTLRRFLFLEGEFFDSSIHCNYEKVNFVEARVSGKTMSDILMERNNEEVLMKLVMYSTFCTNEDGKYFQIAVQANIFDCGGLAISLCLLHELMDATTLSCFLRSWVAINIESFESFPNVICSDFGPLSSLFDPRQNPKTLSSNSERESNFQKIVIQQVAIQTLQAELQTNNHISNPTCLEVMIGIIWKCALKVESDRSRLCQVPSILTHAVNLHNKMQTCSPKFSVGNYWWVVVANCLDHGIQVELSELVSLLRHSFQEINNDLMQGLLGNNEGNNGANIVAKLQERDNLLSIIIPKLCICTNWEDMNLNELVDFGWGNAIWIGTRDLDMTTKNIVILLRSVSNDEIEVCIVLNEEGRDLLVQNQEFCNFASLEPTIPRGPTRNLSNKYVRL